MNRIRIWPSRRDDHSGGLIGTGGTRRSDSPRRACEERSIARVFRKATARIQLLYTPYIISIYLDIVPVTILLNLLYCALRFMTLAIGML